MIVVYVFLERVKAAPIVSGGQNQSSSMGLRREEMIGSSWCFTVGSVNLSFT